MNSKVYHDYIKILKEELVPALGCTEPIAVAYACAEARKILGVFPEHIQVKCSGNIIKNVKSVIVPGTGNMKGIDTSAVLGAIAGNPEEKMELLKNVTPEDIIKTKEYLSKGICEVSLLEGISNLHIIVEMFHSNQSSLVEIAYSHTNIIRTMKNGVVLYTDTAKPDTASAKEGTDRSLLNLRDIYDFVQELRIEDIKDSLDHQISCNIAIAKEGLKHPYGACVGATLVDLYGRSTEVLAKALPAAGSDARMAGCTKPVVINSGSGNQGLTVSLPVIVYSDALQVSDEKKYRALAFSNLLAVYLKSNIGKLSAYCGVVTAACASGAAITYLYGADYETICETITNTLGNTSGIICDGAKSSCAAKIAVSLNAALLGHHLAMDKLCFKPGEGIVKEDIEDTIKSVSRIARDGMKSTDIEIMNIMLEK